MEHPHLRGLGEWRPLSRDDSGSVWEARQFSLDRRVAVKVYERQLDAGDGRRFLRASAEAGRLPLHAGIVTTIDAGLLSDQRVYLVVDLCPGGSLEPWLTPGNRPAAGHVRWIGVRIADALAAAHASGVLHRGIKPSKILLDDSGDPKLTGFGFASVSAVSSEREGVLALAEGYAAPEASGMAPGTQAGDVYSLAATLYALLAGQPPRMVGAATVTSQQMVRSRGSVPRLRGVNWFLMRVLMTALSPDPTARPTAAMFRDELAAVPLGPEPRAELRLGTADARSFRHGATHPAVPALPSPPSERDRTEAATAAAVSVDAWPEDPRPSPPTLPLGRRRSLLASLVGLALLTGLVTALVLANRGAVTASPAPAAHPAVSRLASTSARPSTAASSMEPSSPSPEATVSPAGFEDCSDQLGKGSYCPTKQECWAGVISVFDLPSLGTRHGCGQTHVYQTFAAGVLRADVRRQSQLEGDKQVRQLCRAIQLDKLLAVGDRDVDWEILVLPPQKADGSDEVFRCLFGRGNRGQPVPLR